jgi:electron transfer flavoprotein beta subunit
MKILVCISKTPDTTSKIAFTDGNKKFDENSVQFIINPYDEWYALVRALELTENSGGHVTTITVGGADTEPIIRKALAIGANDAVRIDAQPGDSYFVAGQIAEYAKDKGFDIVMTGKETIDYNGGVLGGMLAEMLGIPYVSMATKLESAGGKSTVTRDIKGGSEVLEVSGSFVLSAAKGMAEQRIPNMRGIMAARTKPLTVLPAFAVDSLTETVEYEMPPAKQGCKFIDPANAAELIQLLHNEAKVI